MIRNFNFLYFEQKKSIDQTFHFQRKSVSIVRCTFSRNSLISGTGSENGGTTLYLRVRKGTVNDSTFLETNKGNIIKISNNYDGGRNAVHLDAHIIKMVYY